MDKKIIVSALSLLLLAGATMAQEQPLIPAGYYGSVTVNGQPAPAGITIVAKIANEERGSLTTGVSGFYGGPAGPDPKLWVKGNQSESGSATVTFSVNGVAGQPTIIWVSGDIKQVDLTFAGVPAPVTTVTTAPGAPGSPGGGGGGGAVSGELFANIELQETREEFLRAGMPVTYRFNAPGLTVYELVITANTNAGLTNAKVEQLKATSGLVTSPPPGDVYKNINIWLGTSGFATPKNIREGIIRFKVNNSWLASEKVNAGEVSMLRWDGAWSALETKQVSSDASFTYYEAKSNAFSPFAISANAGITPAAQATSTPVSQMTPAQAGTIPSAMVPMGIAGWAYALIAAAVIAAAAYYFVVKKKTEKK